MRSDPDYLWEDARLLADLMIVPQPTSDPFWENEARTVLTAAIAYECYYHDPDDRPMPDVLDVLFGGKAWDDMLMGLRMAANVRTMVRHAEAFSSMNEKTLSSVLQTARSSLDAWSGERIRRATSRADWSPEDLRSGTNPTVYIYVRPNEVEAYLSLLRVFIGQHIRVLTGGRVPPRDAPPILVMLDELPGSSTWPPSTGAQHRPQVRPAAVDVRPERRSAPGLLRERRRDDRLLRGPHLHEPERRRRPAERLSEELGYVDSVHDDTRRRMVEAAELAGPQYRSDRSSSGWAPRRRSSPRTTRTAIPSCSAAWRSNRPRSTTHLRRSNRSNPSRRHPPHHRRARPRHRLHPRRRPRQPHHPAHPHRPAHRHPRCPHPRRAPAHRHHRTLRRPRTRPTAIAAPASPSPPPPRPPF
ncbi:MAG: type IV secretory system conjugative DNA transfer family protein [Acidimicrobiales bacterium]